MEYKVLGKTGLKVSALGFGGIPIQRIDEEGSRKLMHQLMEAGVNYIDSARGYTVSEAYIGYGLEGIRDQFVLATKSMARDKESMARDVEISLKNFRTDYIDLYQIHNPNEAQLETVCAPVVRWRLCWRQKQPVRLAISALRSILQMFAARHWNWIGWRR